MGRNVESTVEIYAVKELSTHEIAVTGQVRRLGSSEEDLYTALYDSDGEVVWISTPTTLSDEDETGYDIIESVEGRLIVTGQINWPGGPYMDLLVFSYTWDGEIREGIRLVTEFVCTPRVVIQLEDSTFLVGGRGYTFHGTGIYYDGFYAARVTPDRRLPGPPGPFDLLTPVVGDTVRDDPVLFEWMETVDPELFDTVRYSLRIQRAEDELLFLEIPDTAYAVAADDLRGMAGTGVYLWDVTACSGLPDSCTASTSTNYFVLEDMSSGERNPAVPQAMRLSVYPNPFNATARIAFDLPQEGYVLLNVFDVTGRLVGTPVEGLRAAGSHSVFFDGKSLSSGLYICRLEAGAYSASRKIMLLK